MVVVLVSKNIGAVFDIYRLVNETLILINWR